MIIWAVAAVFFLAVVLGRNNLSNIFGFAIGTRMISFRFGVAVAAVFVVLGAFFSGAATAKNVSDLGKASELADAFALTAGACLMLLWLGKMGCPASVVQTTTGAYVALNFFYRYPQPVALLIDSVCAWFYTPLIGAVLSFSGYRFIQFLLRKKPVRLLVRDKINRGGLICVGAFSAYAFGANNIGSVIGPLVDFVPLNTLLYSAGLFVALGFLCADKRVIKTISKGVFPLTSTEGFVVVFMSSLTLMLFSSVTISRFVTSLGLPWFQLVPIPLSSVLIGSVFGIALSKGISGLKFKTLGMVLLSWIIAPLGSGICCFTLLSVLKAGGL